ncbi:MAG: MGMT family protein [Planctomycetes bacterium]|nr:MGMT family protein [Planctomycetota bacterium]
MPYDPNRHGPRRLIGPGLHARVQALVATVPPGAVTTYGDVAQALGGRQFARHVGFALAALPSLSPLPWWRVVAAGGWLSLPAPARRRQARRLEADGVAVLGDRVRDFERRRHVFAG